MHLSGVRHAMYLRVSCLPKALSSVHAAKTPSPCAKPNAVLESLLEPLPPKRSSISASVICRLICENVSWLTRSFGLSHTKTARPAANTQTMHRHPTSRLRIDPFIAEHSPCVNESFLGLHRKPNPPPASGSVLRRRCHELVGQQLPQWQVDNPVGHLLRLTHLSDQLNIRDDSADALPFLSAKEN